MRRDRKLAARSAVVVLVLATAACTDEVADLERDAEELRQDVEEGAEDLRRRGEDVRQDVERRLEGEDGGEGDQG